MFLAIEFIPAGPPLPLETQVVESPPRIEGRLLPELGFTPSAQVDGTTDDSLFSSINFDDLEEMDVLVDSSSGDLRQGN